jgi:hypothetical protein
VEQNKRNPDYPDAFVPDYSAIAVAMSFVFGKNYLLNTDGTNIVFIKVTTSIRLENFSH